MNGLNEVCNKYCRFVNRFLLSREWRPYFIWQFCPLVFSEEVILKTQLVKKRVGTVTLEQNVGFVFVVKGKTPGYRKINPPTPKSRAQFKKP